MSTINEVNRLANELVFIHVEISCWSGKKTLTPEDLGLDRTQLPPETLVSLGNKQLIDPEALRVFTSLRSSARRGCLAVGVRFLGGYAVPTAKAPALLGELDALGVRYAAAKTAFLTHYDQQIAAWADQQPLAWQPLIREALVPASYVGGRLNFAVQAVRFAAPDPQVVAHPGLHTAVAGLSGQVLSEVAQVARETLKDSFQGKAEVTRRALGPFKTIHDKLNKLGFLDTRFREIVGEIRRLLSGIPAQGLITGRPLEHLRQFLCLASQPDSLGIWAASGAPGTDPGWIGTPYVPSACTVEATWAVSADSQDALEGSVVDQDASGVSVTDQDVSGVSVTDRDASGVSVTDREITEAFIGERKGGAIPPPPRPADTVDAFFARRGGGLF